jgi:hypothetical protein
MRQTAPGGIFGDELAGGQRLLAENNIGGKEEFERLCFRHEPRSIFAPAFGGDKQGSE